MSRPEVLKRTRRFDAARILDASIAAARAVGVQGELADFLTDDQLREIAAAALEALAESLGRGDRLAGFGIASRILDEGTKSEVSARRAEGASWTEVAACLGVTKQAAHQRFRDTPADQVRTKEVIV